MVIKLYHISGRNSSYYFDFSTFLQIFLPDCFAIRKKYENSNIDTLLSVELISNTGSKVVLSCGVMLRLVHKTLVGVVVGPSGICKSTNSSYNCAVVAARAMDDQQLTGLVAASDDADVFIVGIKHKVAG